MNKTLLAAAAAVVILGAPALAMDAMMKASPMDATMMCRPSTKAEKPEAMMGTKGMVCKSMDKTTSAMPKTKGMDGAATDKAWRAWIQQAMTIPLSGNG
jgi:hypothetical protein